MLPHWFTLYQEQYQLGSWHSIHFCHTCWPCSRRHRLQIQNGSADGTIVGLFFIYFLSTRSVMLLPLGSPLNCSSSIWIKAPLEMDPSWTIFMSMKVRLGMAKKTVSTCRDFVACSFQSCFRPWLPWWSHLMNISWKWYIPGEQPGNVTTNEVLLFFLVAFFFFFFATA